MTIKTEDDNKKQRAQDLPGLLKLPVPEKVEFKEVHCRFGWWCLVVKIPGWCYVVLHGLLILRARAPVRVEVCESRDKLLPLPGSCYVVEAS